MNKICHRLNVIGAVILRDMRTRYGRSHLGYVIAIMWPLSHLVGLTTIFTLLRSSAPIFGSDNAVYLGTGILPYILVLYPSRMVSLAIDMNRQLFIFPEIKALDIIIARVVLELITAFIVVVIFSLGCALLGINILPRDPRVAAAAIFVTVYLSISFGLFSTIIVALVDFWKVGLVLLLIVVYLTSGVFLPMATLSPDLQRIFSWNPLTHCVEWLRSAYFLGYGASFISRAYVIWVSTSMLFLALVGERFMRGRLMRP